MGAERRRRVREVFEKAAELEGGARGAFLERACAGDAELRREVEELLAHDAAVGDAFLSGGAAAGGHAAGDVIGRYRLLELVGEGGFGAVHRAEQVEPVRREVAVKVIKLGMDTRQVVARFQVERQALALMDHPHIARVLDAGATAEGRPFFVMEFVRGRPITAFCDANRMTTRERLGLFLQVCAAVQHAHQKGLIHRDLKPGNILVEEVDGAPAAKVIDFGISRAVDTQDAGGTLITERGQLIGTPEYMSPEQAAGSGAALDTRTDIYSLGVVLYELLTGMLPFDAQTLRSGGIAEAQRVIREVEPRRPSARTTAAGARTAELAALRGVDAASLERQIRGDLDWIVLRAMEKDPARRYQSASELAADVRRHLAHEPVSAGPPGAAYRARKFVRRHRVGVAATGVVALALVAGVVGTTLGLVRAVRAEQQARASAAAEAEHRAEAERARDAARAEAAQSSAVTRFLQDMLGSVRPSQARGKTVAVADVLDAAALRVGTDTKETPKVESALRVVIGDSYRAIGRYEEAERHLAAALALTKEKLGAETLEHAEALDAHALLLQDTGKYDGSERENREALRIRRALLAEESAEVADSVGALATTQRLAQKFDEAEALSREALALRRKVHGEKHERVAGAMDGLAQLLNARGKFEEAEGLFRESLAVRRELLPTDHPDLAQSLNNLASVLVDRTRYAEAEPLYVEALGIRRRVNGERHQAVAQTLNNLASLKQDMGDFGAAEEMFRESLAIRREALGEDDPTVARAINNLAALKYQKKEYEESAELFRQVVAIYTRTVGAESPMTAQAQANLAATLGTLGRNEEALEALRAAVAALTSRMGADHPQTLSARHNVMRLLEKLGRVEESEAEGAEVLALRERVLGKDHPDTLGTMRGLAWALALRGKSAEAERMALDTWTRLEARASATARERLLTAQTLAGVFEKTGKAEESEAWKKKAAELEAGAKK